MDDLDPTAVIDTEEGAPYSLPLEILKEGVASRNSSASQAAIMQKQSELANVASLRARETGEAATRSATTVAEGMLAAQMAMQESMKLLSGDVMDPNSLKAISMKEFVSRAEESKALLEDVKAKQSVSFFDNPLEYIVNQMDMPTAIQNYNLTATQANTALATVNAIDSTLTREAEAQKAVAKTLTVQSIADNSKIAAEAFNKEADAFALKAMGANIDALKAIQSGNSDQIKAQMRVWEMTKSEEGLRLQQEAAVRAKQQFDYLMTEKDDKIDAKKTFRDVYTAGRGVYNLPIDDEKLAFAENLYKTPEGKQQLQRFIDAGIRKLTIGDNNVGMTPGVASYNLMSTNGNWKDSESLPAIKEVLGTAQNLATSGKHNPKNRAEFSAAIDQFYFGSVSADGKSRKGGALDSWNTSPEASPIYKDPGLQRVASSDFVAETPFYKTVLAPSVLAKTQQMPALAMVKAGMEAVKLGQLSLEDVASGISTYYQTVGRINAMNNSVVGIPPQTGYNASVSGAGAIFSKKYDLANQNQVMAALLQMQANTLRNEAMFSVLPNIGPQ